MSLPDGFPTTAGAARDAAIIDAARARQLEYEWAPVVSNYHDRSATFFVTRDGVRLGGVRLAGSASLCQHVADLLSVSLGTPRLNDLAWLHADVRIAPQTVSPNTTDTDTMVKHSMRIDDAVTASGGNAAGLIMPIGKPWCLAKGTTADKAALYGWQSETPIRGVTLYPSPATPGVNVIQELSRAHYPYYVDYSSSLWFVSRQCTVDGQAMDLWDVLRDPVLAFLASHEGALPATRQPGVGILTA